MSRCFPFPPPGYEKKRRSDHEDLLLKEKQKEKRHKKEKKDKEKREGKERKDREKDKDRSKDKHREKKHKKEKQRDKDKKKNEDRDNDKKRVSNDRKGEHTGGHNEGKLGEESCEAEYFRDPKFMEELGKGTRDESGAGDQMAEKIAGKVQRTFDCIRSSAQKERIRSNKMVQNITIPEQRRMDMVSPMEDRGTDNAALQNSISEGQRKVDGMGRSMVKDENKKIRGKEKAKEQEIDYGKGEIPKDQVQEKMHKGKNKDGNKEKEKEKEKIREKGEHKHKVQDKLRVIEKREQLDTLDVTSAFAPKDKQKIVCADGSLKRKEINGFLHENEMRCNKLSRPSSSSSSQLPLENGKLDQSNIHGPCASRSGGTVNMVKMESKSNGVSDVQPPTVLQPPKNSESLKKAPHPDEKYLSRILQVPKMVDWPEFDDQDWLFSRDNVRQKPKTNLQAEEGPQVWASALHIESADVLALPYVIPY